MSACRRVRWLTRLQWVALLLALSGCASLEPLRTVPPGLLDDTLFPAANAPVEAAEPLALSTSMRQYLNEHLVQPGRPEQSLDALVRAVTHATGLKLRYDASRTRSAAEAFDDRAGNCLSLVLMTAAFARELGLRVDFQAVDTPAYWSRHGEFLMASEHVNLGLTLPLTRLHEIRLQPTYVIDFLDADDSARLPHHSIPEQTVVAMFFNNRAAEALLDGDIDNAYALVRTAVRADPGFVAGYNTLGLVYLKGHAPAMAVKALETARTLGPTNPRILANLVDALEQAGDAPAAARIALELERVEPEPPFHFLELGIAAIDRHEYRAARRLFREEARRADYNPELHYWLARLAWLQGDLATARVEMSQAAELSTTTQDQARYGGKLEWLARQR